MGYVVESPSDASLVDDERGMRVAREFTIEASSKVQAYQRLQSEKGIVKGVVYVDANNNSPNPYLRCVSVAIGPEGRELMIEGGSYVATAYYENILQSEVASQAGAGSGIELVPDGPAVWSSEPSIGNEAVDIDTAGAAIANSAGVPFDPAVRIPAANDIVLAEWVRSNQRFFDALQWARTFYPRVNASNWKGAARHTVLCHSVTPTALDMDAYSTGGLVKYKARFEFKDASTMKIKGQEKSVPGWHITRIDKGRQRLNPNFDANKDGSKRLIPILAGGQGEKKEPVSEDALLDGNGQELEENKDPIILEFDAILDTELNDLGI